ncbi:MAG: glycosyltransferase family 4 protein [Betaproteobacteria bacterium]|nr:glycosyltransferase family 4 protein [Betaproteobacteria bacterium]
MKILYHHRTASKDGQAVHIEELIAALRQLGHEVCVVGPANGRGGGAMGDDAGWVHKLKRALPKSLYELLELSYSLIAYRHLAAAAKGFRPDFIYERYNLYLLSGVMLKRRLGIPLLLEVNAPLAEERRRFDGIGLPWLAHRVESQVWRGADHVLPVTKVLAKHVAAAGVPPERIAVIPNGINRTHFAGAPTPETAKNLGLAGKTVLGFTGFVRDWHGVDRIVRWLASADAPENAVLMVVGDGPARPGLERLADDLALRNRVRFTGVVDRERVPEYVAAFDIALQPAVVPYASPLKLFEYLALGKPVVAPRQPNIEEILTDEENALLFDPTVPQALERILTRLCVEPALRERLAVSAAATIERFDLTWLGNAKRVVQLAGHS